ncbi:expressed unknown protein [Ectocarpus siliculosus]|uniref:Uncharacterized protein n=1 Tax=Ectocarpus siliculosus TaxID=2880 RepID=D7FW69_ECTSI|nr:expressed unknown protein [Ectocarpus siliculosus]|eukprot:CBJ25589.1 expressed unknown protein [Ectocarpus siliculosus]
MKLTVGVASFSLTVVYAFQARPLGIPQGGGRRSTAALASTDGWVALPVNPSAGGRSRTVSFSPSNLEDLQVVEKILQQDQVGEACVLIIPSWRHHPVQYDCLSACLEALKIPTAVQPLPDGLWALLLQRLQVHSLRKAARKGVLEQLIVHALHRPFNHLDLALRLHSDRNTGRRITVIASDDSAWLVRAFVNSRSQQWRKEVPLDTAVLVGGYHKSIVGDLALDVFPNPPPSPPPDGRVVKFFSLNGREGGRVDGNGDIDLEASISCMSFEEDSESCILQEYEVEHSGWLSLLGSTSLLSLWVPRVLRA